MKATPKFCVHCGTPFKPGEKFCMKCGAQLVRNLYDKTPVEPTEIKPTEVEPTEIKPTEIKPTEIKPTEIEPTEIKPTEITPTEIEPTPIEPTPIKPGVMNRFLGFFTHPSILIFGLVAAGSTLAHTIAVTAVGFKWWNVFFLLLMVLSYFEVVLGIIQLPAQKTKPDGSKRSFGKVLGGKFKSFLRSPKTGRVSPKNIVGAAGSALGVLTLAIFFLGSCFSKFKNFVVLEGHTFLYRYEAYGYNPETDGHTVEFLPGGKAISTYRWNGGKVVGQYSGTFWRIGSSCGLKCTVLEQGTWSSQGISEEWGDTTNFEIVSAKEIVSGGAHFYRID